MKEMGWQSLTIVRLDPDLAPVPLILYTMAISVIRDEDRTKELRRWHVRVLPTPFDLEELLGVVVEVLAARQAAGDTAAEYPARE